MTPARNSPLCTCLFPILAPLPQGNKFAQPSRFPSTTNSGKDLSLGNALIRPTPKEPAMYADWEIFWQDCSSPPSKAPVP